MLEPAALACSLRNTEAGLMSVNSCSTWTHWHDDAVDKQCHGISERSSGAGKLAQVVELDGLLGVVEHHGHDLKRQTVTLRARRAKQAV